MKFSMDLTVDGEFMANVVVEANSAASAFRAIGYWMDTNEVSADMVEIVSVQD